MVDKLVGLHGGVIAADSVVGEGTTFTVRPPLGSAHLPACRVTPEPPGPGPGSNAAPYVLEALRWSAGASLPATEAATGAWLAAEARG